MTTRPPDSDPTDPTDWDVVAKYLAGEATEAEVEAARAWLEAEPGRADGVAALDRALDRLTPAAGADVDVEEALRRVHARIAADQIASLDEVRAADQVVSLDEVRAARQRKTQDASAATAPVTAGATAPPGLRPRAERRRWERWPPARRTSAARIAAGIALVAGAAGVWWIAQREEPEAGGFAVAAAAYETGVAETDSIRLMDGTMVVLGPLSRLDVPAAYGETARVVELDGLAAFDVVHDDARPFTVMANGTAIRDLGTRFTVRTEPAAGVSVAVTEGRVAIGEVGTAAQDSAILLNAGDLAVIDAGATRVERNASLETETAWIERRLVFESATLARVADSLWRWYGIELRIEDPALAERTLTTTFDDDSVDDVLRTIELVLGARIERRGDTAFVRTGPRR